MSSVSLLQCYDNFIAIINVCRRVLIFLEAGHAWVTLPCSVERFGCFIFGPALQNFFLKQSNDMFVSKSGGNQCIHVI
ncbi:hypothetical protein CI610_03216 [invertebrate metagenome]|uniref:Uncharacterized protein n=1 Tax=invertebrate metagenome TaxID=1711999 RepID=A0A2H9T3Q3_9ZZZZ